MSIDSKISSIFKEQFQIKRVLKEINTIRESKQKMGFDTKMSMIKNVSISIHVQIMLKAFENLQKFGKLQFKITITKEYPILSPRIYITGDLLSQMKIKPFRDYLKLIEPDWNSKITILNLIQKVPSAIEKSLKGKVPVEGAVHVEEYFQIQRIFSWAFCKVFPVKVIQGVTHIPVLMVLIYGNQIVLLKDSNIQNSYQFMNLIMAHEVYSVMRNKLYSNKIAIQIKLDIGGKYALQIVSEGVDSIIESIVEMIKSVANIKMSQKQGTGIIINKTQSSSESSETEQRQNFEDNQAPNSININEIKESLVIYESLIDTGMTCDNVNNMVILLKKAIEYYSATGDPQFEIYLKKLKDLMNNEMAQTLMNSLEEKQKCENLDKYTSIVDWFP